MHYILYLAIEGFYVGCVGTEPGRPTLVHRDGVVLDACPQARERGVVPGTALGEAKAVLRDDGRCIPFVPETYTPHRDRWLDVCLGFSDRIEPGLPHEAYIDLTGHPRPERVADDLLVALAPRALVAGLAPGKWIARADARSIDLRASALGVPQCEAVTDVVAYLSRIPTTMLLPLDTAVRERLCFLGYRWARDVARAGTSELRSQFGTDAFLVHETAHGRVLDQVEPSYPERSLLVSLSFGGPLDDSVRLDHGLTSLAQRCAATLCDTDQTAQGLVVRFESEEGANTVSRRAIAKPVQTATALTAALRALWTSSRCTFPPVSATVHMTGLRPAPRRQRSFTGSESVYERKETCERVVRTLTAAYGDGTLVRAADLEPARRVRLLRVWKHATGWR